MILAGVDLAWQSENNPSAIASGNIDSNILLLQAQLEKVVDNTAQDRIIEKIHGAGKVVLTGGFHELLNESKNIFEIVCSEIFLFLKK